MRQSSREAPAGLDARSLVHFNDLEFAQRPVCARTRLGFPFTRWVPTGVPKIPHKVLDGVCYLYSSEEAAEQGRDFGGTGFLVAIPSAMPGMVYTYVVSNWHVAVRGGHSVVRINTTDGGSDHWAFGPEEWSFDPKYDIAAILLPGLRQDRHKIAVTPLDGFISRESVEQNGIGPGDDVFMVGRFIDHDGGRVNRPAARFGHISVSPTPIVQPNGQLADSYLIEMNSRSGYSGSPVFVYRTPGFDLNESPESDIMKAKILFAGNRLLGLLGIHYAQFPEPWEVVHEAKKPRDEAAVPLITDGMYVKGLSGMACVLPSWTIVEVLNRPKLKAVRDAHEADIASSVPPAPSAEEAAAAS